MIIIRIESSDGSMERNLNEVDESWINQQINRRRAADQRVCLRVTINEGPLNMVLSTPNCAGSGGGSRAPNAQEQRVFELWNKRRLDQVDFTGGDLVSFLKQLEHYL